MTQRMVLIAALAAATQAAWAQLDKRVYPLNTLAKGTVSIGVYKISVWIMDTPGKRTEGMMYLSASDVKPKQGMLFVFPDSAQRSFWNRNVHLDLDIAFLDGKGKVVRAASMRADDPTSTHSLLPAKYVLEMKKGEFHRLGIREGATLGLPRGLKGY